MRVSWSAEWCLEKTIPASPRLVAQKPFQAGICKSLKNHQRKGLRWTAQNQTFRSAEARRGGEDAHESQGIGDERQPCR